MTIILFAAILLAAQAPPAPQPNDAEELFAQDHEGQYYLDPASISRDGDRVTFRFRADAGSAGFQGSHSARVAMVIDCARRMAGFLEGHTYDREGRAQQSVRVEPEEVEYFAIRSEFAEEQMRRRVCPG